MSHTYTVVLNDAENKALLSVAVSAQDWIENAVRNRCRIAIDEIVAVEVERITTSGGTTLSGTKEDIVVAAPVKSAAERQAEYEAQMAAKQAAGGQA